MATEILATGTAAGDSTDVVVAAGTPVTVFLKAATSIPVPSDALAEVKVKSVGLTYHTIGVLTGKQPALVIDGPGTYQVSRIAGTAAFGIDKG